MWHKHLDKTADSANGFKAWIQERYSGKDNGLEDVNLLLRIGPFAAIINYNYFMNMNLTIAEGRHWGLHRSIRRTIWVLYRVPTSARNIFRRLLCRNSVEIVIGNYAYY